MIQSHIKELMSKQIMDTNEQEVDAFLDLLLSKIPLKDLEAIESQIKDEKVAELTTEISSLQTQIDKKTTQVSELTK